jgi:hypothetical protein
VIGGRNVDASQVNVVWRGSRRIQLSELEAGEKVKVWGTLRGDGIVVADEIQALTSGSLTWVTFTGRVDSCSASLLSNDDVVENPNPTPAGCSVMVVSGVTVKTAADTKVRGAGGKQMSVADLKLGQSLSVEGWKKPEGWVQAGRITIL